jgi:hypothetical protein
MNIAIYQGFTSIHFEMFGYLFDYFLTSNITFHVFTPINNISSDWLSFYNNVFNSKLTFNPINQFDPSKYSLIILVTDDDMSFKQEWLTTYNVLCIDHSAKIRRKPDNMLRIGTRFFYNRPICPWALPIYTIYTKYDKQLFLNDKINVTCIGIQNRPPNDNFLKELFVNFDSINFHIITRKMLTKYQSDNIFCYENCPTTKMMDILKNTHYILCLENPNNLEPVANSMSAAIPLAFSTGCQLIIPESWNKYYSLKSIITYQDKYLQKNNIMSNLTLTHKTNLDSIYNETYQLINHRNYTFDKLIKINTNNYNNSLYSTLSNIVTHKYNILIDLTDNEFLLDSINDFREIYANSKINNRKIFNSNNINIYNFKEPFIIHINNLNILPLLSKRSFNDLIIIKNIENINSTYIYKLYNKMFVLYKILNNLIILPL